MSRRAPWLAAALAGALALDVWLRWPTPSGDSDTLPAFDADDVASVRLQKGDDEWTLVRDGARWKIPPDRTADAQRVGELLAGLSRGVPLDAQVDRGAFEDYGLAGADPVRVDVFGPSDAPLASLVVGFDAGGGATWVRRPGDDAVFRARVGGRGRYDRPLPAWRDRQVVAIADLREIRVARADASYTLLAGAPWTVAGDPAFEVDPLLTREVARVLGALTALDVVPASAVTQAGEPLARVTLVSPTQTAVLSLWPSLVTLEGESVAFRVAPALTALLGGPLAAWSDHTVWTLDPAAVTELRLEESERVILARQPGGWSVVEPAGVSIDPTRTAQVAAFLAAPRVDEWIVGVPEAAGFLGGTRVVVATGAERRTLEIGGPVPGRAAGREAVFVRDPRRPERIGTWSATAWGGVRAGFGR